MALIRAQMKDDPLNHFSNNCSYQPTSSELKAKTGPSPQTTLPFSAPLRNITNGSFNFSLYDFIKGEI